MYRKRLNPSGQVQGNDCRQADKFRNPLFWSVNVAAPNRPPQPIHTNGIPFGLKVADPTVVDPITQRFLYARKTQSKITK